MRDTSPVAETLQLQIQSRMSWEQRLLLAFEMSLFARDLAREGIRRDHPRWSEAQIARELLRLAFLPAPLPAGLGSPNPELWTNLIAEPIAELIAGPISETRMSVQDVLKRITTALDRAGIGYMLTGSFASAHYGAPRSTQDIDFVIEATAAEVQAFVEALPRSEYYVDLDAALEAHRRQSMFNVIDLATGWKIDLIIRKSRAFSQEEFRRRQRVSLNDVLLFVASAEDVVISKLEWAKLAQSRRQIEDAAAILRMRWDAMDRFYLEKWIGELGLTGEWGEARRLAGVVD
jgi:hypothetical protein